MSDREIKPLDTSNTFGVTTGSEGREVLFLSPPRRALSPDQALVLAARLVRAVGDATRWAEVQRAMEDAR